jgi:glutamine amidotransferase
MIVIIDGGGANIASIMFALERLGKSAIFTSDTDRISQASHVILPGVGAALDAMRDLRARDGLEDCIKSLTQPVLGICLGMQLLFRRSEEGGDVPLLGLIDENVHKFKILQDLPVPHMGWNSVTIKDNGHAILKGIPEGSYFYFVHSYYVPLGQWTQWETQYHHPFSAAVKHQNFFGVQFHPEKSGNQGLQLLKNFLSSCNLFQP